MALLPFVGIFTMRILSPPCALKKGLQMVVVLVESQVLVDNRFEDFSSKAVVGLALFEHQSNF